MSKNTDKVELSAPLVHSALAAAMADPSLLESWRHTPEASGRVGFASGVIDIDKLWQFSGLVTKVRHNDVRLKFPLTFRLLDHAHISIELFAAYARVAAEMRDAGIKSKDQKASAFYDFIDDWLDRRTRCHALVWDLIRHEHTLKALESSSAIPIDPTFPAQTTRRRLSTKFIPVRKSNLIIHDMGCNPLELAAAVRTNIAAVRSLPYRKRLFAYCQVNDAGAIRVLEIDAMSSVILDLANGRRSLSQLATMLHQIGISAEPGQLCKPVAQLLANGLLYAGTAPRT
jgi:hypothetical protein